MVKFLDRAGFQTALIIGILILGVFVCGCSDQSNTTTTSMPTTTPFQQKFVAGDIIAKTATSTDTFWLIMKYDSKMDTYERALVYKKSDGSWYRKDDKTEQSDRSTTEKIYPAKIFHVSSLSNIPVATPTKTTAPTITPIVTTWVPTTTATTITTATTATQTTTTGTTTTTAPAPTVMSMMIMGINRYFNSSLRQGTNIVNYVGGSGFQPGASVKIRRSGSPDISMTYTQVLSGVQITGYITIPIDATPGQWDVVVTNPDGQSGILQNGFVVIGLPPTTTPTPTQT